MKNQLSFASVSFGKETRDLILKIINGTKFSIEISYPEALYKEGQEQYHIRLLWLGQLITTIKANSLNEALQKTNEYIENELND